MSLGSLPATHRKSRKAAQKITKKHGDAALKAAKRGACGKAITELTAAFAWYGVTSAEHLDSGPKKKLPLKKFVHAARAKVLKSCPCKRR
jgi:hypothetical protein